MKIKIYFKKKQGLSPYPLDIGPIRRENKPPPREGQVRSLQVREMIRPKMPFCGRLLNSADKLRDPLTGRAGNHRPLFQGVSGSKMIVFSIFAKLEMTIFAYCRRINFWDYISRQKLSFFGHN